jgi:hypothetical protein
VPPASVLVFVPGRLGGEVLDEQPQSSCSRPMSRSLPFALGLFNKAQEGGRGSSPTET